MATSRDESSSIGSRARLFSVVGSSCEADNLGKGKQQPIESFDSDVKPSALAKALSNAKSVRTKKTIKYGVNEKDQSSSQSEEKSFVNIGKHKEPEKKAVKCGEEEIVDHFFSLPKPKPSLPEFFGKENEDIDESCDEDDSLNDVFTCYHMVKVWIIDI
ncbi:zinc finger and BTB domain-containing protein 32 [Striga asiatica]|uniref:Zinc finger and BTB domain-containing protein 32 n=1 Tax=Striga asiatica TaxID=4170 RepID=A0A5A7QVX1_STRAF|nr:zinc finger and BTB domain-containing protein 32 [Striga asiatica]